MHTVTSKWVALAASIVVCGVVGSACGSLSNGAATATDAAAGQPTTSVPGADTETVQRGDLIDEAKANGSVAFGEPVELPIDAEGIVTETHRPGDIVSPGDVIVGVGGLPVYVAEGAVPLYRELRRVGKGERDAAGNKLGAMKGEDVAQLQRFLVNAGYEANGKLTIDSTYGYHTERAVKAWQKDVGHVATGRIDRSQMLFVPAPVRVVTAPPVGATFTAPTITPTQFDVSATIDGADSSYFEVGANVTIVSAGTETPGTVITATPTVEDGSSKVKITITPDPDAADLSEAVGVELRSERVVASDVLHVPVRALIATADGSWALQPTGGALVEVELVDVVNGEAQIDGVDEGTEVEVPA